MTEDDTAAVALTFAAVAAASQRVLLIDADLERRTLSAIDADQTQAGLVDVATGRRALSDVIIRDRETNLNLASFVAPSSRRDRPISEADVRQAFDQTKRFDMVDRCRDRVEQRSERLLLCRPCRPHPAGRPSRRAEQCCCRTIHLGPRPHARKVRGAVLTGARTA